MATLSAAVPDVLRTQPGLLGDATKPGLQALSRLVTDAEAALQAGHLQVAQSCLDTYFAEINRRQGVGPAKSVAVDQFVCRAHFAAGQLVSKLSRSCKGKELVDAVLEAIDSIMRGVELATANPRYSHLVYNGSVHYWHVARPLQCDKLRHHLLPSQEKLCQALEKVEGQQAWRVRQLLSLALCQGSEEGKPDEVPKTLAKALDLATAANLQPLRAEVLALQTHHQTVQAAKAAAGKPGGAAGAGGKAAGAAAPAPPAAPKQAAPAGKRKPGEPATTGAGKADVDGALALLQWVLSAKPDATLAEQQLQTALKLVNTKPDKPGNDAHLRVVGRIGWAAAVSGATQLAEQCTRRAATSQELGPRAWADLTRLLLSLKAAPEAKLGAGHDSSGTGASLDAAALQARREVLEGADEVASAFLKLGDVEGIHNAAVLAWNAGLPLLQPSHRGLVKPAFTAVAKALEAVGSPWTKLRAALHLEVAKTEADADSFMKAAKEVSTALSLNYPSSADMAATCGYERPLDRYLEHMARAAQLRGVAPVQLSSSSGADDVVVRPDDDVVLLLERAKDSKSAPLRSDYLQKAVNKLALLPAVAPPSGPAGTEALQQQLRAARTRTQLWADVVELAWRPCQLDAIVRSAAPFVLEPDWQPCGDKEMLILQARIALVAADAAKAALSQLDAELVVPPGYGPSDNSAGRSGSAGTDVSTGVPGSDKGRGASGAGQKKGDKVQDGTAAESLQRLVADYLLQGMQLSVAAGGVSWLVMNGAMAAWNAYLPLLQKERYADLAGLLLPVLQTLLQEPSTLQPNQLVMLAEAAAKAAEHVALLKFRQLQQQQQQQEQQVPDQKQQGAAVGQQALASALPWYKPLAEARAATAGSDVVAALAGAADVLQLASDTAAACQTALTRAAAAAEPQGLIQSYARLQQLQGKPFTVPPGAPAAMADTSKLLALIEGLTASVPGAGTTAATPAAGAAAPAAAAGGRGASAASGTATVKPSVSGGKGAPAAAAMSKPEQDIRTAMALLTAMPTVNLQLWAQLSRAAGWHGQWLLARDCANAALGALPADKRDLLAVTAATEVPDLGAQGWYWLSVVEMQQGQAVLSLLPAAGAAAGTSLSIRHAALQHFATAVRLASFIRRADLAESAARLGHNTVVAPGGLLETDVTRAAAVKALTIVTTSLNATRPADIGFQVKVNLLLLECLSAAGRWTEARKHLDALHRSLPVAKQRGPAAAVALEAIAGWRATCLVKVAAGHAWEEMPRLLSELSTPHAKARAWLAFAQATTSPSEQLQARQAALVALAALDTLAPEAQVEYQLEFAQWLATSANQEAAGASDPTLSPEQLLLSAAATLDRLQSSRVASASGGSSLFGSRGLPGTADGARSAAASAAMLWKGRASTSAWGGAGPVSAGKVLEQLIRVHMLLSQVAAAAQDRTRHLMQAQAFSQQLLTSSLLAAGAEAAHTRPSSALHASTDTSGSPDAGGGQLSWNPSNAPAADGMVSNSGGTAAASAAKQQPVPALALSATAGTMAPGTAGTARLAATAATSRGLPVKGKQLPCTLLDWATWQPDPDIVQKLKELAAAADANSTQSAAGSSSSRPGSVPAGDSPTSAANSAWGRAGSAGAQGVTLSKSSMRAPELLLANLMALCEQLRAAGRHAAALPAMQLARLVAVVTLQDEASAAVAALELSALCEQLGLPTAAAADWLQLAAPEQWPNPEQMRQAEASKAMQQLSMEALQAYCSSSSSSKGGSRPQSAASSKLAADGVPDSTGFLREGLAGVEAGTLQSWLPRTSTSSSSCGGTGAGYCSNAGSTWGSRVGSAQGRSRPASAAGARAAAAALAAGVEGGLAGKVDVLQVAPVKALDSWVTIARYLVDHAQYTAGQKLCGTALELARSSGDVRNEAEVLLLQARLALLAQHYEEAVKLSQAAQALGGSVQLWRDSVLCYAVARSRMLGRGPADALEALEGCIALLQTVARGHSACFRPSLLEASARLKLQLAKELTDRGKQRLSEAGARHDPSSMQAAAQLQSRALTASRDASADAEQAGALMLQVQALRQAAELLMSRGSATSSSVAVQQQHQQQRRRSSGCGSLIARRDSGVSMGAPTGQAAAVEAVQLLQAAWDALAAASSAPSGTQLLTLCSRPTSSQMSYRADMLSSATATAAAAAQAVPGAAADSVCQYQIQDSGLPTACAAAAVLVQLAEAELLTAKLQLQDGLRSSTAAEPEFPKVEGRDPQAVIAFLTAAAAAEQASTEAKVDYLARALQHSQQAVEAAAAAEQPRIHAAALLALGKAHALQAHAVLLDQQQDNPSTGGSGSGSVGTNSFDCAWLPWPDKLAYRTSSISAGGAGSAPASDVGASAADSNSSTAEAAAGGQVPSSTDPITAAGATAADQGETAGSSSSSSCQPPLQLPPEAEQPYKQAVQTLQQALQEALQHQELATAEAAARALAHCYGLLQPEQTAWYLAVAQSCSSAEAMQGTFEQAAALQHAEVLLWRQLQQLESIGATGSVYQLQAQQLLGLLGISSKRLQVPATAALQPVLSQLQHNQRLLMLHHDPEKQQLVLAAWGVPGATLSLEAQAAMSAAAEAATAASAAAGAAAGAGAPGKAASQSGGAQSSRARKNSAVGLVPAEDPASAAAAAAAAAVPPPALLGSMPCTQQQLQQLTAAFAAYSKQLQKAIMQAITTPVPASAADLAAAAAAAATAGKKHAGGATNKVAGKEKGSKDAAPEVPSWVPATPVFPHELNEQWQQLMQQFEQLLQPVTALSTDALQMPTPPPQAPTAAPAVKQGKSTSTNGGKASSAAAAAAAVSPRPVPLNLQLLLDPMLCELPWEALSVVRRSCSSVARCLSLAQLQQLLVPPQTLLLGQQQQQQQQQQGSAVDAADVSQPVGWELGKLSYLVDPLHHMSSAAERPGCYAAPLLPSFKQQVLDTWGQEWQGFAGVDCQVPGDEQMLRPLVGSKGLVVLTPGRLLGHVGAQAVAGLDLSSCTAALLLDRLDNPAAAAHQIKADNRKTEAERALEGPCQTALLLMLRGVRAVALAALPGTPHTHLHLAANVLRGLTGVPVQSLQLPSSTASSTATSSNGSAATAAVAGGAGAATGDFVLPGGNGPWSLAEAVAVAQRQGLAGFELQALREAGMVVYGLAGVVSGEGVGGGGKPKVQRKG